MAITLTDNEPAAITRTRGIGSTVRSLYAGLPLLIYLGFAQSMLNIGQVHVRPALPAATILAPLAVAALCLYAHATARPRERAGHHVALAVLLALWMAAAFIPTWIDGLNFKGLMRLDEATTYVAYLLLATHCLITRGRASTAILFGAATLYGFVLESSGVSLGFFAEPGYDHYLPFLAAPLMTMLDWSTIFYPCVVIVELLAQRWPGLQRTVVARALLVAGAGLALDIQLDPVATRLGLWHWHPLLQPFFVGVPLVNFVAWFWAMFGFGVAYYGVERLRLATCRRVAAFFLAVPAVLAAEGVLWFLTMIALEGADGPTVQIMSAYLRHVR